MVGLEEKEEKGILEKEETIKCGLKCIQGVS
jgi:hypothetical protein